MGGIEAVGASALEGYIRQGVTSIASWVGELEERSSWESGVQGEG